MRLTVVGTGYLGLTHAVCMAELGHDVMGLDEDAAKVASAGRGEAPFFEPGLEPLLRKNLREGRLRFTTSFAEAAGFGNVHFLCVGTPEGPGGAADLHYVYSAVEALAANLCRPSLVVGKSTVPVGTARKLAKVVAEQAPAGGAAEVAWNPEFLREGHAVHDSLSPSRLVFGVSSSGAAEVLGEVYADLVPRRTPVLIVDLETAELVKVAANAFLATKISFINAMAEVCEKAGADVVRLADALGRDERIGGAFLAPGLGFGGGCLPKDLRAFSSTATGLGVGSVVNLLAEVDAINLRRRSRVVELAREVVGGNLAGRRVGVLGLAFKPGSDDVRDSPSLDVCRQLLAEGAVVSAHDPVAGARAAHVEPELHYASSAAEAAKQADVLLHLTEWADYRAIDPAMLAPLVAVRNVIDARCALDERAWRSAGWCFYLLGRRGGQREQLFASCESVAAELGARL